MIETINEDIETYSRNIIKYASQEIRDRLEKKAKDAIEQFYQDYTPGDHYRTNHPEFGGEKPWFYDRTGNLRKAYRPVYMNHGDHIKSGIILSPEFMDDVYEGTKTMVFNMTWGSGFHGHDAWEPYHISGTEFTPYAVTSPSPLWCVKTEYQTILQELRSGKIQDRAEAKASRLRENKYFIPSSNMN